MTVMNSVVVILFLFPLIAYNVDAQEPVVYDITKYGATQGADIKEPLYTAWKLANVSTVPTKVVIPEGNWNLSQVELLGNKAPLELEVRGTVHADSNYKLEKVFWIIINYVNYFTLSGGGVFDGHGQDAWKGNDCHNNTNCTKLPIGLSFNFINHSIIRDVTSKDPKNWHANCISSNNVTFQRFTISAPGNSPNTDGIHIARGTNINVLDSVIGTGDDCISIGDQMDVLNIQNVTCGPGHGISVGSLGRSTTEKNITGVNVKNCTFKSTDNGVRVKTWPSAPGDLNITGLHFEDLTMVDVSFPVIIDQFYCPWGNCNKTSHSLIKVSDVKINNIKGTTKTRDALIFLCSGVKPCEHVEIGNIEMAYTGTEPGGITSNCTNIYNAKITGKQNIPLCPGQDITKPPPPPSAPAPGAAHQSA